MDDVNGRVFTNFINSEYERRRHRGDDFVDSFELLDGDILPLGALRRCERLQSV
jgi:hypothetical protein